MDPIPEERYRFEEMAIVNDVTVAVDCDGRTSLDAFNRSYRIATARPWTLRLGELDSRLEGIGR